MWTIATPFINKPLIIPLWLESFKKLDFPRHEFKLLWLDMSGNAEIGKLLKAYIKEHGHEFKEVSYIEKPLPPAMTVSDFILDPHHPLFARKRANVAETMNILNQNRQGHMLLWEDDIIAPPDAWQRLKYMFDKSELFMGVTGTQYYRHPNREGDILAWNWQAIYDGQNMQYTILNLKEKENGVEAIGASASGFTLYRKEFLDGHVFGLRNDMSQDMTAGFRMNGFDKFPFGGPTKLMMVWNVKFLHLGLDEEGRVKAYMTEMCKTVVPKIH